MCFAAKETCHQRDGAPWNELANENDAAPPVLRALPSHVKPENDLLEGAVERNRQAGNACIEKEKADNALKVISLTNMQLCPWRNEPRQKLWLDLEADDRKVAASSP